MNTKEEFAQQFKDINEQIKSLQQLKKDLELEYLNTFKVFELGEKVKIITPEFTSMGKIYPEKTRFAFIRLITCHECNISYSCVKMKKDGTPSMQNEWIGYSEKIEKP